MRLQLDRLWWMVTPGNPLKQRSEASLAERVDHSRALARHPRMDVTAFEASHGVRYTADTIALVRARNPGVFFVWIMAPTACPISIAGSVGARSRRRCRSPCSTGRAPAWPR